MAFLIGGTRAPYLDIAPYDGSTVVTLTVTKPDGTTVTPAVSGPVLQGSGAGRWSIVTPYTLTQAADWYERWTATNAVTGLGAGSSVTKISVEATPPPLGPGQTAAWATPADYANIIGGVLPDNLLFLLRVATLTLRSETGFALYDATEIPTAAALKEACCLQVKYATDNGWTTGAPVLQRAASIGSVTLGASSSQAGGSAPMANISPLALEVLAQAGLTTAFIGTDSSWLWW